MTKKATTLEKNLHLHPYLTLDEHGLATLRPRVERDVPNMEFTVPVVKFHAMTRECPIHGMQDVRSRNFQPAGMHSTEGLACGHTVLISRDVKGLRKGKTLRMVKPTDWKFHSWRLVFLETIFGS